MKIVIGIPTGKRSGQAVECVKAWKGRGFSVCVLTWDQQTVFEMKNEPDILMIEDARLSYAINQNKMMRQQEGWDVWICGADDLWPGRQKDLIDRIELVSENSGDKLIWVGDGFHNAQPTHPIITRKMFEAENGVIFDEKYHHNFTDTDLFARMLVQNRVIKCFDIMFDHRHFAAVNLSRVVKEDEIYRVGQSTYAQDAILFHNKWGSQRISTLNVEEFEIDEAKT